MFCFIDQMPKGMRDTLYFKDDDSRLSFLQGNYITLTNMSDRDVERIVRYRLEPINISFQTTNPELRCKMLHNRFAGDCTAHILHIRHDIFYILQKILFDPMISREHFHPLRQVEFHFRDRKFVQDLPHDLVDILTFELLAVHWKYLRRIFLLQFAL